MEAPQDVQAEPAPKAEVEEEEVAVPKAEEEDEAGGGAAAAPAAPVVPPPDVKPEEEAKPPAVVSDEQIVASLRALLSTADMATTTEKMLRKSLEQELGCELSHKKALIREEVQSYINSRPPPPPAGGDEDGDDVDGAEDDDEAAEDDDEEARPAGRQQPACALSPELSAFLGGVTTMPRTQVVKAIWAYIKAHGLQDPACRRNILPDALLGTVLTAPVTMFSMNKQLSAHVTSIPGSGGGGGAARPRSRAPSARRRSGGGGGGGKARGGFAVPVRLSADMAEVVGRDTMTRADLTKWFWNYFRTKDLLDPDNKRYVVSDDRLKKLFGEDRFLAFGIQRLISPHVIKGGAAGGGGASGGGSEEEGEEEEGEPMDEEVKEEEEAVKEEEAAAAAAE